MSSRLTHTFCKHYLCCFNLGLALRIRLTVLTSRSFLCLGVSPPALALWDVDGDSFEDVLLRVTQYPNETHPSKENKSTCLAKN